MTTFTDFIATVLGSTFSVVAIELCKLSPNVASAARPLMSSVLTARCKLLLTTLASIVSPVLPVAVAARGATAFVETVTVTAGGLAYTALCRFVATLLARPLLVLLAASLRDWAAALAADASQ